MENIKACIKYWLKNCGRHDESHCSWFPYYGFINEYEQHYIRKSEGVNIIFTEDDFRSAALFAPEFFMSVEVLPECIYLYLNDAGEYLSCVKDLIMGYEVHVNGNEFTFDLIIDLNDGKNEIFKVSVNDILNDFFGEDRFTRGLIINDLDELKSVFQTLCAGCAELSYYVDNLSCPEYFNFLTQTDFLDEYEKMNLACHRSKEYKTIVDKKTVMDMLKQYDGTTVKYFTQDRFFRVIKNVGDVRLVYEVNIRKTLLSLFLGGSHGEKRLFGQADIERVIKDIKGIKLHSLQFQSVEELKGILDFIQKYFDVLTSFFDGASEK